MKVFCPRYTPRVLVLVGLVIALPVLGLLSLWVGSVPVDLWALLSGQLLPSDLAYSIVFELRLPRVMAAFFVGGLLALAGLLMQALLKNPLADPYILGVSAGAGLGGVSVALLLPALATSFLMPLGAAAGALLVVVFVFSLGFSQGRYSLERLLLIGLAISSLCTAWVSLLLTFTDSGLFKGLVFWLLGELSGQYVQLLGWVWCCCVLLCFPLTRALNVAVLGDDLAHSLGISLPMLRNCLYWLAAIATGVAVAAGGMIGFVGLVVPHVLRLLMGYDHRFLVPACALGGGLFLLLADTLARWVFAPIQLPVGVVTAVVGAPVFIYLLKSRGGFWRGG